MKKLVVGSFAFVLTLMLFTNVFADGRTLSITEYCGEKGLINRGNDPVKKEDTLNIKNNIKQDTGSAAYGPEENRILEKEIVINGGGHTLDGNLYDGFKMEKYDSGESIQSEINNAKLTNYNGNAISVVGYSTYLSLYNVNISSNSGKSISLTQNANLFVSNVHALDGISGNGNLTVGNGEDAVGPLVLGGDSSGFNGNVEINGATVKLLANSKYFDGSEHYVYDAKLDILNNSTDTINISYLRGDKLKIDLDVDLENEEGDKINVTQASIDDKIVLNKINVMSDTEKDSVDIEVISSVVASSTTLAQKKATGGLYVYDVKISSTGSQNNNATGTGTANPAFSNNTTSSSSTITSDTGNILTFKRIKDAYNPEILQSKVAVAGVNVSQEEIFDTVFNNAGNYTFFQKQGSNAGDVEDRAAPTLWVKAFGSQEDVDLEKYTKVKTTYYGAVVGLDWDRQYTDNFDATYGIFASYVGGELKDDDYDNKVKQNGGYAGLRANWYIGKLFVNGIVDYGMIQNSADTTSDSNDFNSQVIGLAARLGYNFEVARRSFTIQPSVGVTGKYIITEDFETIVNSNKIKEEIDNITNITIEPGLKLALNLGKCWILTGEGKYVIENYNGDTKITGDLDGDKLDLILPEMSYKNYTNVGLGIEKIWGYTVLHLKGNKTFGGRDGIVINAGIEFKF